MIDELSSASGHDYASDRSAIGAGDTFSGKLKCPLKTGYTVHVYANIVLFHIEHYVINCVTSNRFITSADRVKPCAPW